MERYTYDTTVPESYWPQPDKPWRVSWGFGAFADFATEAEAWAEYDRLRTTLPADWPGTVNEPFNAIEMWADQRITT